MLFAAGLVTGGAAQPAQAADVPPNPLEKPGWVLDRNDEFNGSLDSSLWITNYLESRTPEWRSRARYNFRNNALVLRIDDDQPTYYSDNAMKVSSIQTGQRTHLHKNDRYDHSIPTVMNYTPKYGYFEIRAKSNGRSGFHTAFWMIGRQDTWEQRGELDIMEHAGIHGRSRFNYNLFPWSDPNLRQETHSVGVGFDMTTEMHIYAVEWTPTQLKLYIDNVHVRTINQSLGYPAVFLLGAYENAGWTGGVDPNDPRPKEFVVDYFRAYKKDGDPPPPPGDTFNLVGAGSGKCVDVPSASQTDGTGLIIYTCHSNSNQRWTATSAGELRIYNNTKCMDSVNGANGARVVIASCDGTSSQKWTFQSNGAVTNGATGRCLDVNGGGTADNTAVIVWDCHGGTNQQWTRQP